MSPYFIQKNAAVSEKPLSLSLKNVIYNKYMIIGRFNRNKPIYKVGIIISSAIFFALSNVAKAEDCNSEEAINRYNAALSNTDIDKKLELLTYSASACSATYEILVELGDAYFENQQIGQAINTYSRTLNSLISDSQSKQAKVLMRLMYAYDSKGERLTVNQYAHKVQILKANGMIWDEQSEQAYQALYQKTKQQLTTSPVTAEELRKSLNEKNNPSNKNLALVGVNENISSPSVQIDMDIKFATNSSSLTPTSKAVLKQIISTLANNSDSIKRIKVIGHTDTTGTKKYNQNLSEQRAQTVSNYIQRQLPTLSTKITSLGLGESQPIDTANTAAAHATNRRVVFSIQ